MENQKHDFSKSTVAVLLVLAILISVLSTWTLFNQIKSSDDTPQNTQTTTKGNIQLKILSDKVQPEPVAPQATGMISLQIRRDK